MFNILFFTAMDVWIIDILNKNILLFITKSAFSITKVRLSRSVHIYFISYGKNRFNNVSLFTESLVDRFLLNYVSLVVKTR